MEGPSLYLAAVQLAPFVSKRIEEVSGNTKQPKERLLGQRIGEIFPYGKYLFFQFETFALRIHFMLYGTFEAVVDDVRVTGDYSKTTTPRLRLDLKNGHIDLYNCSVQFIETSQAKELCDFSNDIMSGEWDSHKALLKILKCKDLEIGDVLLDQEIFRGVGNIIRNESLLLMKLNPQRKVEELPKKKIKELIDCVRNYVFQFYEWRKIFELKKHYRIYRQSHCKNCGGKVTRMKTGRRQRISFICPHCEK